MLKASIVTMEKSCPTKHFKSNAEALLNISASELSKYIPISSEMRHNKHHAISLINQALALLTEFDSITKEQAEDTTIRAV